MVSKMTALLTVDKLSKTYQATNKKAVKDISFTVDTRGARYIVLDNKPNYTLNLQFPTGFESLSDYALACSRHCNSSEAESRFQLFCV
ncbi:hypothetical protein AEL97_07630 [Lactobacillus crispatus]|nr:hypothetical protein AEL97_07630 [Lactobacillus crispatus]